MSNPTLELLDELREWDANAKHVRLSLVAIQEKSKASGIEFDLLYGMFQKLSGMEINKVPEPSNRVPLQATAPAAPTPIKRQKKRNKPIGCEVFFNYLLANPGKTADEVKEGIKYPGPKSQCSSKLSNMKNNDNFKLENKPNPSGGPVLWYAVAPVK